MGAEVAKVSGVFVLFEYEGDHALSLIWWEGSFLKTIDN